MNNLRKNIKLFGIIQARLGSMRFPKKVVKSINGKTVIEILLNRLNRAKELDGIIVATGTKSKNEELSNHIKSLGYLCEYGDENNVLDRYISVAKKYKIDAVVRITGDCPLIDPLLVDDCVKLYKKYKVDYVSNIDPPTYPDGLDVEVISVSALEKMAQLITSSSHREHVTTYIRENKCFAKKVLKNKVDLSSLRWTVDTPEDFEVLKNIINSFKGNLNFSWLDILKLSKDRPELFKSNNNLSRNFGGVTSNSQKLWKRAKKVIPNGCSLLSKNPEQFAPNKWPTYYSKAKGCTVWDVDGNKYIDTSIMGIGTNILGYANPIIDRSVHDVVNNSNMSSLNCPEEVILAEKLIELHPWAEMVRFARTGGEANAISIRIARNASGKDQVAVCGYHGWHDWYLAANLGNQKSLDGHLLPGLSTSGVPRSLKDSVFTFDYNNIKQLKKIVENNNIGVIKMEVTRTEEPNNNFLQNVREIANKNNIVLIFDECTSGFRQSYGGIHKLYEVEPDIAIFGKALGNGYAITSVIGRRNIMECAEDTFISSTFWTERIGPTAALKTLELMHETKAWEIISETGKMFQKGWKNLADNYGIKIKLTGIPALATFTIDSKDFLKYKTLITQKMLEQGFLANNTIYSCIDHSNSIIDQYFEKLEPIFKLIQKCENGLNIDSLLNGPVCKSGFKRLN